MNYKQRIAQVAILTAAVPFMLAGGIFRFAVDAFGAGMDAAEAVLDATVDWIDQ